LGADGPPEKGETERSKNSKRQIRKSILGRGGNWGTAGKRGGGPRKRGKSIQIKDDGKSNPDKTEGELVRVGH